MTRFSNVATHRRAVCRSIRRIWVYCIAFLPPILLSPVRLVAQSVCERGNQPLNSAQPSGITPAEIISAFAAKETAYKSAREHYGYTLDVTLQTLTDSGRVDGEYRQNSEIILGTNGAPIEKVNFAPQSTLRRIAPSQDDFDDIHFPVAITADELHLFSIEYQGRQRVDMLDTYVFDVFPQKNTKNEKEAFRRPHLGGRSRPHGRKDLRQTPLRRNAEIRKEGLCPSYPHDCDVSQEIDGKYWFPTYATADEFLHLPRADVHVREVVRYSNYKLLASK